MPLNPLARRVLASVLGLALASTVVACTSHPGPSKPSPVAHSIPASAAASPSVPAASASPSSSGNSTAVTKIKTNWETFFNGRTPASTKIELLQNGQTYATIIRAQAGSGLATETTARVNAEVLNSATSATVSYDINLNGTPALPNQTGTAVNEGGIWKVDDGSFCGLLRLENDGKTPSECA